MAPCLHSLHRLSATGIALQDLPQKGAKRYEGRIDSSLLVLVCKPAPRDALGNPCGRPVERVLPKVRDVGSPLPSC